ncbi:MAG: hypothetical protein KDB22_27170 [Planctomycetales bacterium]|nr:hypothetical protein [Planctomycetales bacterium]
MKKVAVVVACIALLGGATNDAQAQVGYLAHNVYEYGHAGPAYTVHRYDNLHVQNQSHIKPQRSHSFTVSRKASNTCSCQSRPHFFRR